MAFVSNVRAAIQIAGKITISHKSGAGALEASSAVAASVMHDDEEWQELTEDDVAAEALAGTMFTAARCGRSLQYLLLTALHLRASSSPLYELAAVSQMIRRRDATHVCEQRSLS
jgi:hypothetical protein